jgi:hypothetical protein
MREASERARSSTLDHEAQRSARRPWLTACLLAGALAAASFAPLPVVLPVASVVLVLSGCAIAAYSWFRSERRDVAGFTRWDQAGLFVLAGFAAALIGDSAETLSFIEAFVDRSSTRE